MQHSTNSASEMQNIWAVQEFMAPRTTQFIRNIITVNEILLGWVSLSLEVFIRYDFGERYLGAIRIIMAALMLLAIYILPSSFFFYVGTTPLFITFAILFVAMVVWHRLRMASRHKQGIKWHSYSFGVSLLGELLIRIPSIKFPPTTKNDWILYRFVEPSFFFCLGIVLFPVDLLLGFWLMLASTCLFVKNQLAYYQEYDRILDIIDGQIEADLYNDMTSKNSKRETAGFSIVSPPQGVVLPIHSNNNKPDIASTVAETLSAATALTSSD